MNIVEKLYKYANQLPKNEMYGLRSQITRAAVSIPSNIAEGCSRHSNKEFKRYLEIAIGSSFEVETQLILCNRLGFEDSKSSEEIIKNLNEVQKQINSLIQKLKRD